MIGFGRYNPFPYRTGGGTRAVEVEHRALLRAYEPGFNVDDDGPKAAEAYAEATLLASMWACNRRATNQGLPLKMIEALPNWESSTGLRPSAVDADDDRRRRLAAKLAGTTDNTLTQVTAAAKALLGSILVAVNVTADESAVTFWHEEPGPPGFEWCSTRSHLWFHVTKDDTPQADFERAMAALVSLMSAMLPAWVSLHWSTGSGFIIGESAIGEQGI